LLRYNNTPLSWNELLGIYKKYCSQLCIAAVDYSSFCKIRIFIKNSFFIFIYIFSQTSIEPPFQKTGDSEALDRNTCLANNALNSIVKKDLAKLTTKKILKMFDIKYTFFLKKDST